MDKQPLVSIVTPSYNQAEFIEATILSVKKQDYPQLEHLVIDGGSTDGTVEVLKKYPHLKWISEPDNGQAHALAKGFEMARGDILAWLNSDDIYLEEAVSRAVSFLKQSDKIGLVYSNYVELDREGRELRRIKADRFDLERAINEMNIVPQPAAFFTRTALNAVGGMDQKYHYAMDYDLWIRIGQRFSVHYVDDYWAGFRIHPDSKTVARAKSFWKEEREISRRYGGKVISRQFLIHYHYGLYRRHPGLTHWLVRLGRAPRHLLKRPVEMFTRKS
jgi:glycosyltransferase involved in cell wall biosynthesis